MIVLTLNLGGDCTHAEGCVICIIWNGTKINLASNYYISIVKVALKI